ncbi:MAG TPA: GNAT family N-acetyltransferase [Myxococcota bacterium]|nr:GNAT family N-acetyltransferase [Myxococcota bacterium]
MIRPLSPEDLDEVLAINQSNRPAVGDLDMRRLRELVGWSSHFLVAGGPEITAFLIVLGPGEPYGSLNYRWFEERFDAHAYVDRIAVHSDHQGLGLGARLYQELFRLEPLLPTTCEVNIRPMNAGSLRFHRRHGFEIVGEQDTEGGDKRVALMARYST